MKYAAFCTEGMAKGLHFLPVEMAPGHLIDSRDIQAAIMRIKSVACSFLEPTSKQKQLELF